MNGSKWKVRGKEARERRPSLSFPSIILTSLHEAVVHNDYKNVKSKVSFQLGALLENITRSSEDMNSATTELFDPSSALFICNKWDTVPGNESDAMKENVFSKLSACWPGLEERQVCYVSTKYVSDF